MCLYVCEKERRRERYRHKRERKRERERGCSAGHLLDAELV
jgi:hypothetical protein